MKSSEKYRRNRRVETGSKAAFSVPINGQGREPFSLTALGDFSGGYNTCGSIAAFNFMQLLGHKPSFSRILYLTEKYALFSLPFMKKGKLGAHAFGIARVLKIMGIECAVTASAKKADKILSDGQPVILLYQDKKQLYMHFVVIRISGNKAEIFNRYNNSKSTVFIEKTDIRSITESFGGRIILLIIPNRKERLT